MTADPPPHRPNRPSAAATLRRWWGRTSPVWSAPAGRGADSSAVGDADLIADIVEMTEHAARDGLPLSAVLDDLRLVLHLGPADVLPVDALRACALAWARASQRPAPTGSAVPVTLDDLEGLLWDVMGSAPDRLPGRAVVVRLRASGSAEEDGGPDPTGSPLLPADLLSAAADLLSDVFDRPDEQVVVLSTPPRARGDRVVALLPGPAGEDGTGDDDRLALSRATLATSPLTSTASWAVELHQLAGHPKGLLDSVRDVLGPG